jgi:hypothetical protein
MRDAWHVDSHIRRVLRRPSPRELLVGFLHPVGIAGTEMSEETVLHTVAGKFTVEQLMNADERTEIMVVTKAPGLVARLGLTVVAEPGAPWSIGAHTSVHPTLRLGRLYFRCIEPFHHFIIEFLLWRFCRRLRTSQTAAQQGAGAAQR